MGHLRSCTETSEVLRLQFRQEAYSVYDKTSMNCLTLIVSRVSVDGIVGSTPESSGGQSSRALI